MKIWMNGTICDEHQAVVSVYDHGFLYGMGLFETFRTYNGVPFLLREHLLRLQAGCEQLGIAYQPDELHIRAVIARLLQENELTEGYFRLTITAGADLLGLPSADYSNPTEIVYVKSLGLNASGTAQGKSLQLLRLRRNTPEGDIRQKSLHYMNNILAKRELTSYPWSKDAEGLFLSEQGYLAEGIVSNLFFMKAGVVYTPTLDTGILPGITRAYLLRLMNRSGIRVEEGHYHWADLQQADAVFMTNSIQELVPIHSLYDEAGACTKAGNREGEIWFAKLAAQYREGTVLSCK